MWHLCESVNKNYLVDSKHYWGFHFCSVCDFTAISLLSIKPLKLRKLYRSIGLSHLSFSMRFDGQYGAMPPERVWRISFTDRCCSGRGRYSRKWNDLSDTLFHQSNSQVVARSLRQNLLHQQIIAVSHHQDFIREVSAFSSPRRVMQKNEATSSSFIANIRRHIVRYMWQKGAAIPLSLELSTAVDCHST